MRWINDTVAEFGHSIGIPSMRLDESGNLRLNAEDGSNIGIIYINSLTPAEVVLYRAISLDYLTPDQFSKALKLVDFRHPRHWQFQVGCSNKQLVLAIRFPERAFIVSTLGEGLETLQELLESIKNK